MPHRAVFRPWLIACALLAVTPRALAQGGAAPAEPDLATLGPAQKLALRTTFVVRAVQRAAPAVLSILATRKVTDNPWVESPYGSYKLYPESSSQVQGLGSGVIVDARGYAVTNAHVVSKATDIRVRLRDGRVLKAKVVGASESVDVAILRIESPTPLPVATLGRSADLMPGETAIAIGNPLGLSNTVSFGVISSASRTLHTRDRSYVDFVQTDAAVNPGNSGGPLVNAVGEVIGINTMGFTSAVGLNFAIPADRVRLVLAEIIRHGHVRKPTLGMSVAPRKSEGVTVEQVDAGGPAARAGIKVGDVVLEVRGQTIEDRFDLRGVERTLVPGMVIPVRLARGTVSLTVDGLAQKELPAGDSPLERRLGFNLDDPPAQARVNLAEPPGPVIREVARHGTAASLNLRPGDVVLVVGSERLKTVADVRRLGKTLRRGHQYVLRVRRGPKQYTMVFEY